MAGHIFIFLMHHRDKWPLLLFFSALQVSRSQVNTRYCWPIDSPVVLTANYGEIRPNHFHAGLDFSTNGLVNLPVYAAQEGYLSRIRVSPVGYGRSVYITHPDGRVTVYAHLSSFSMKLDKVIKKEQYARKINEIDFLPLPNTVLVKRNEIIGLSGNSGGSTGPHLHFEVRDEKEDMPLNPLKVYSVIDRMLPEITHVAFYSLSDTTSPKLIFTQKLKKNARDSTYLENNEVVLDEAIVGLAFCGFDKTNASGSENGIYSVQLFMGERLIYAHQMDKIPFSDGRYVNEFTSSKGKIKLQKCFLPTLYPERMYQTLFDKGRILLPDTGFQKLVLVLTDEAGNTRSVSLKVKTKNFNFYRAPAYKGRHLVNCNENVCISDKELTLFTPARTLYQSVSVNIENSIEKNGKFTILPDHINLNAAAIVGFKVPAKFRKVQNKLVLKNKTSVATPEFRNDSVFFNIKSFDTYQLLADTLPPKLKALKSSGAHSGILSFRVLDELSGVGKYDLFINDTWMLLDYDAKNDHLSATFDEIALPDDLQLRLEVEDKAGNKTTLRQLITR